MENVFFNMELDTKKNIKKDVERDIWIQSGKSWGKTRDIGWDIKGEKMDTKEGRKISRDRER